MKKGVPKEQDVRIIVAFADITGFSAFTRQSHRNEFRRFMHRWDNRLIAFSAEHWLKDLADGLMTVERLGGVGGGKGSSKAIQFLEDLWDLQQQVKADIERTQYPRPSGFRVCVTAGWAWEWPKRGWKDYLGRPVNNCAKMLRMKSADFLAHGSVKDLISKRLADKAGIAFDPILRIPEIPGTPDEEIKDVYKFSINGPGN